MRENSIHYVDAGAQIRAIRIQKGYSQAKLAKMVGISAQHLSHIETGQAQFRPYVLVNIANALEVSPDLLMRASVHTAACHHYAEGIEACLSSLSTQEQHEFAAYLRTSADWIDFYARSQEKKNAKESLIIRSPW